MSEVVVVATFVAKPGRSGEIERFGKEVVQPSHEEDGCVKYALHRSTADPETFVLVEKWRSQDDLDAHFQQPHMAQLGDLQDALAEPPTIHFLEPLPYGDAEKGRL